MIEWSDKGIIIAKGHFHEKDMWLKALFREHGLVTIFAFGASTSKRRFCGCLDILNSLFCKIKSSRNEKYLNLQEASLIDGPHNLRVNWKNMGVAANCLRFLEAIGQEAQPNPAIYDITEELRRALEGQTAPHPLFPQLFRLHLASLLGFAPHLGACGECGRPVNTFSFFRVDAGNLLCEACSSHESLTRYDIRLSANGLKLLRNAQELGPAAWVFPPPDGLDRRACSKVIDGFVQYHLGLAWDNGSFRHI